MEKVFNNHKIQRNNFQLKFNNLVSTFEALSENELKMLNKTNINIRDLNLSFLIMYIYKYFNLA